MRCRISVCLAEHVTYEPKFIAPFFKGEERLLAICLDMNCNTLIGPYGGLMIGKAAHCRPH
jgi:hypothetical protein